MTVEGASPAGLFRSGEGSKARSIVGNIPAPCTSNSDAAEKMRAPPYAWGGNDGV